MLPFTTIPSQYKEPRFLLKVFLFLFLLLVLALSIFLSSRVQLFKKEAAEVPVGEKAFAPSREEKEPEYVSGEVLVKFLPGIPRLAAQEKAASAGVGLDKQAVSFSDLDDEALPIALVELNKKYPIKEVEKVFKEAGDPKEDVANFKAKFPGRASRVRPEAEDIDLSRTYKLVFDKGTSVEQLVQELSQNPKVEYVEPNYIFRTQFIPNDPYYLDHYPDDVGNRDPSWNPSYDYQWNLKKINMEQAWDITTGDASVTVAVVDTGVDCTHPELVGQCVGGRDFANGDDDPMDDNGHGTHVAGTIGALTNHPQPDSRGTAGISFAAKILPVKVLDDEGAGRHEWVADGIEFAADQGVDTINLSLGNPDPIPNIPFVLKDALDYALTRGVVVVAAAGNSSDEIWKGYWPAHYKDVISVGAISEQDTLVTFSNFGNMSVVAPGGESTCKPAGENLASDPCYNILSLKSAFHPATDPRVIGPENEKDYLRLAGTSMAAPHVTALAALLLSKDRSLSNLEVKSTIEFTSADLGEPGIDTTFGYGIIDGQAALELLSPPPTGEVYSPDYRGYIGGTAETIGTVGGRSFDSYTLELGEGENPNAWTTNGIMLTNNGTGRVDNGTLALVDTSGYTKGIWTLRFKVQGNNGTAIERKVQVFIDPQLQSGWPRSMDSKTTSSVDETSFLVTDMDNDGEKEVIAQGKEHLYIWDARGQLLPNFPKYVGQNYIAAVTTRVGRPAVGDIDGDGQKEAVFVVQIGEFAYQGGPVLSAIHVIRKDGSYLPGWPIEVGRYNQFSDPVLEDMDDDGKLEILVPEAGAGLHAYKFDGDGDGRVDEATGWPKSISVNPEIQYLSVADLEGDGVKELVIVASDTVYVYPENSPSFRWSRQLIFPGNPESWVSWTKPTLTDLNNDGTLEIIVASGPDTMRATGNQGGIFVFTSQGQDLSGWPQNTRWISNDSGSWNGNVHRASPAVGDVDKDGGLEIVVGTSDGRVMIYKADGTRYNILFGEGLHSDFNRGVALGDLNSDGTPDIIAGARRMFYDQGAFFAWDYQGNSISGWPKNVLIFSTPQLTDIDNDGKLEIVALGKESLYRPDQLFVWEQNGISPQSFEYPMYGYDERRTGRFPGTTVVDPISPTPSLPPPTLTPFPTLITTPTAVPNPGRAVYFNDQDFFTREYITIENSEQFDFTDDFSFEFWIKPERLVEDEWSKKLFYYAPQEDANYYQRSFNSSINKWTHGSYRIVFVIQQEDGTFRGVGFVIPADWLADPDWFHVAFTSENKNLKLYINGQLLDETSYQTIKSESGSLFFLAKPLASSFYDGWKDQYYGRIDDFRISNQARDVSNLWQSGEYFESLTSDEHALALWHFEGNLQDSGSHGYHGVAQGNIDFTHGRVPVPSSTPTPTQIPTSTPIPTLTPTPILTATLTPTPPPVCSDQVDYNNDGKVSVVDFGLWLQMFIDFIQKGIFNDAADLNWDNKINVLDFSCFLVEYNKEGI